MSRYDDMALAQFENVNSLRSYPFAEGSSLVDSIGRELSKDVVVDVHMVVPAMFENPESGFDAPDLPSVRLSSVHISRSLVSACFISDIRGDVNALSVSVLSDGFRPYTPYRMEKLHGSSDIGGIVTFGDVAFGSYPETYFFDNAFVHPCCIAMARPAALRRFIDRRSGESLAGDASIEFSGFVKSDPGEDGFSLSLKDGADRELASECAVTSSSEACGATPIVSINGVLPDSDGNIVLWFH